MGFIWNHADSHTLIAAGIAFALAFIITAALGPIVIPWLHKLKFGQEIREEGPSWHQKKSGTPTMGGLMFLLAVTVSLIVASISNFNIHIVVMLCMALGFGLIGFIDDYIKVVKKRNLGLTSLQKFSMQAVLAIAYILVMYQTGGLDTQIIVPFVGLVTFPMWLYVPLILFVILGTVNAVNLTDGLDGLAASITTVVSLCFAVIAFAFYLQGYLLFALALVGGCLGFLIYNKHPAKVFMGDTGSLFLGGAVSALAIGMKLPLILIIAGFVYLFEALSVIIQVTSYKLTGKRVFKMSPVHHHFELCGWSEKKIVLVFTAVTALLCVVSILAAVPFAF
jgi:phospho-N-acetylmuramoyl-pentapeptide-transferase